MEETTKKSPAIIGGIIVLVLAVAAYGAFKYVKKDTTSAIETTYQTPAVTPPTPPVSQTSPYKDGTYSAVGDYFSPGGAEQVGVQVTIKNGIITDATAQVKATRPESVRYQGFFVANFKPLVVGKSIDSVTLSKVSGSSLTPRGFNDALAKIKVQAKA